MMGRATPYLSDGESFIPSNKPDCNTLAIWDKARMIEPIIKEGLNLIALSVAAKVGEYSHPDPLIREFVSANIKNKARKWVYEATKTMLWAGFATAECVWQRKMGPSGPQVWIDDVIQYHPICVDLITNESGRLTHGETVNQGVMKTGVWVPKPLNSDSSKSVYYAESSDLGLHKVRLPKGSVFHTSFGFEGNNPYGTSMLTAILDYHLFKRAIFDLMMVALDRYGTPLVYVVVPNVLTDEVDPEDPDRRLKLQEVTARELSDIRTESVVVFSQPSKDQPVEMKSLTTSNNFADSFTQAIELCDLNMMMGLGIPNLIMRDTNNSLGSSGTSERQVELFHHFINAIYNQLIDDLLNQTILQLIQYNFDPRTHPSAIDPGSIASLPIRHSETKIILDGIDILTKNKYIDPSDPIDADHVRQLLYFPTRSKKMKININPTESEDA